ncbi:MAG TPA: ribonuclease III [Anaerolineaceae bacterium]|nr:ribonuclease III [Anaerolineaceae bacterium]
MINPIAELNLISHLPEPFKNIDLLRKAMCHRSYLNENEDMKEDNERLEFLGDSILGFLVAEWLYKEFPQKPEGFLTKARALIVRTQNLAKYARSIDIGPALLLSKGEELTGARERDAVLCDAFEALIAAIYIDQGMEAVRNLVEPLLKSEEDTIMDRFDLEPKSRLQEWAQAIGHKSPVYVLLAETGPDHDRVFSIQAVVDERPLGIGKGKTKQAAEKKAAENSLKILGIN